MGVSRSFTKVYKTIVRKKNPVIFNDLSTIRPIGTHFGRGRGTPIDRYYIEKFLKLNRHLIKGCVLEVGESTYSKKYGNNVNKYDVLHTTSANPTATIIGDLTDITTIPKDHADCFICTQTYQAIYDVSKAIEGSYYLLKPGGTLLATVPGIGQISESDMNNWGDYWRFTSAAVARLFASVFGNNYKIYVYGNVLAAIALLQGISLEDLPSSALLDIGDPVYQVTIGIRAAKS